MTEDQKKHIAPVPPSDTLTVAEHLTAKIKGEDVPERLMFLARRLQNEIDKKG